MLFPKQIKRLHLPLTLYWVITIYFAEGLPYSLIRGVSSVFFRDQGLSLEIIGLTSLFGFAWSIKFLWGPLLDAYGDKRQWVLLCQGSLAVLFSLLTFCIATSGPMAGILILFLFASFVAATHDMAIDGYYLEVFRWSDQARFVGLRVIAYRIAMMTGTGIIVTIGAANGWPSAFAASTLLMILLTFFHWRKLPFYDSTTRPFHDLLKNKLWLGVHVALAMTAIFVALSRKVSTFVESLSSRIAWFHSMTLPAAASLILLAAISIVYLFKKRIRALLHARKSSFWAEAFFSYLEHDKARILLLFIIFIRAGEYMLSAMASPFMVDLGLKIHYGWIAGGVGLPLSIVGATVGGWLIARFSLKKMIWPFLLAQNVTNLVYMATALHLAPHISKTGGMEPLMKLDSGGIVLVAAVHGFDQFSGGLGTAVLMIFLMRLCKPSFKAAHYAIGSGLMSVSGMLAGSFSGFLAAGFGYGMFFGISFLASIPGMLLVFLIPPRILTMEEENNRQGILS